MLSRAVRLASAHVALTKQEPAVKIKMLVMCDSRWIGAIHFGPHSGQAGVNPH